MVVVLIANHSTLSKQLNKIDSGKMGAAVRNMLHLNPEKRLSAGEMLKRLMATDDGMNSKMKATASTGAGAGTGTGEKATSANHAKGNIGSGTVSSCVIAIE